MSTASPRAADAFPLWLVISAAAVIGAALFSAPRAKPVVVFAVGFGLATGLALRAAAAGLALPVERRVRIACILLAAAGFGLCFGVGYRRAEWEWNRRLRERPENPVAAAILQNLPHSVAEEPYSVQKYLARRVPNCPSPWPEVVFGTEWLMCAALAGACVGFRLRTTKTAESHDGGFQVDVNHSK